ncbi:MAG: hypothetical protein R3F34_04380 [Planctomycetota bacterium]
MLHHDLPSLEGGGAGVDLVHGDDAADAVLALASGLGTSRAFNLVGRERPRATELLRHVGDLLGVEPRFVPAAADDLGRFDPAVVAFVANERSVDGRRARSELGYRPRSDWRESMRAAAAGA